MRLLIGALLFYYLQHCCTSSEPSCEMFRGNRGVVFLTCRHITDVSQLSATIPRPQRTGDILFTLSESHLQFLPEDVFEGISIKNLTFDKATVDDFTAQHPNVFDTLNATMREVFFRGKSTLPVSWKALGEITALETLKLEQQNVSLDRDWAELPRGVKRFFIMKCNIISQEDNALASFSDLEAFILSESDVERFSWALLPNPAPKLTTLRLERNKLTEIPEGFTVDQFPALKALHVEYNPITKWNEDTLTALKNHPKRPKLIIREIHCDCSAEPLRHFPQDRLQGKCVSPEHLKGRRIGDLSESDLQCSA
uniref:LRRCT domain-containing protein n=1 Tax=Amblyomma maculatum TaxID=34609 RepID=G3MR41_AMBMU